MASHDQTHLRELFGEAFRRYGPPTTVPKVDPSTYSNLYNEQNFFPDIYCDYVDTDELNAMACIYKGRELVAIFAGLINFINPYYAAFLTDPRMFHEIGNPEKDKKAEKLNAMRIEYLKEYPTLGAAPLSLCPVRSSAIIRVIECGLLFLHTHEVAHIILGHIDLLKNEFGISTYEELPIESFTEEECNLRRALELQSDQSAALTSLYLFRKHISRYSENGKFKNADILWSIAVESLFVLFELVMIKKGISRSKTHASPFTRWLNVKVNVLDQAEEHGIKRLELPKKGESAINQVRNWLTTNGLADGKTLFPGNEADNTMDELFSTWEHIKPHEGRLEQYRADRGNRAQNRLPL